MDMYQALADPTRRHILEIIATKGNASASDISNNFKMSAPAISQHLKILREAKLVDMEKRAQMRIYTINTSSLQELEGWVRKMKDLWEERFNRLDELLKREKRKVYPEQSEALYSVKGVEKDGRNT